MNVLFDFDGPIADLFAGHPAAGVAARLRTDLAGRRLLPDRVADSTCPHAVVRTAVRHHHYLEGELEARLAAEEIRAAATAEPTPGALEAIETLAASGVQLAVVTNNAASAIRAFLARHAVTAFGPHVYGRTELRLMKPHSNVVLRAIVGLGVEPADCTMVGDTPTDAQAARRAGVAFIGYDARPGAGRQLRDAGVTRVIRHMGELVRELDGERKMAA